MVGYLQDRGLATHVRLLIAGATASLHRPPHSLRLQAVNIVVGMLTATAQAVRALLNSQDVIATVNLYVVVAVTVLALPSTAHVLAHFWAAIWTPPTPNLGPVCSTAAPSTASPISSLPPSAARRAITWA